MTSANWEDQDEGRLIRIEGELDHDGCDEIKACLEEAMTGSAGSVTIDMAAVTFVSSQGIWMLLRAHKALKDEGRRLLMRDLRPHVYKVFDTVGIFHAIPDWNETD